MFTLNLGHKIKNQAEALSLYEILSLLKHQNVLEAKVIGILE